jgi:hypothetical protein
MTKIIMKYEAKKMKVECFTEVKHYQWASRLQCGIISPLCTSVSQEYIDSTFTAETEDGASLVLHDNGKHPQDYKLT